MRQAIRILHIVGSMNIGGAETWLMHVLRHIDRRRFQMDFCCLSGDPGVYSPEIESLGSRVFPCKLTKNLISFSERFKALLREGGYHVIHSHVHHFSGYLLRLAAREGVPVRIAHSHTSMDGKRSTRVRKLYRALQEHWIDGYSTAAVAASDKAAVSLYGEDWELNRRLWIIRCGIDLDPFCKQVDPISLRQDLHIPDKAKVIGHVGRFEMTKNYHFLLEIAREVLTRRSDVRLLLVGDGPMRPDIERRIQQLGLESDVILAGWRKNVPDLLLGAMDLFCMPSLYEGLPVAAIEAQAAGLPCLISADVTPEIDIVPGAVSFLKRSAGAVKWAEVICEKMEKARIDSAKAIGAIRSKGFDIESSVKSLVHLYSHAKESENGGARYA